MGLPGFHVYLGPRLLVSRPDSTYLEPKSCLSRWSNPPSVAWTRSVLQEGTKKVCSLLDPRMAKAALHEAYGQNLYKQAKMSRCVHVRYPVMRSEQDQEEQAVRWRAGAQSLKELEGSKLNLAFQVVMKVYLSWWEDRSYLVICKLEIFRHMSCEPPCVLQPWCLV